MDGIMHRKRDPNTGKRVVVTEKQDDLAKEEFEREAKESEENAAGDSGIIPAEPGTGEPQTEDELLESIGLTSGEQKPKKRRRLTEDEKLARNSAERTRILAKKKKDKINDALRNLIHAVEYNTTEECNLAFAKVMDARDAQ